jgi:hypothetical protein
MPADAAITQTLDVAHWPRPARCKRCGRWSAYQAGQLVACVSTFCDPHALTWIALDRWYRKEAGKEPLQTAAIAAVDLRARRKAAARSSGRKTAREA